ncbi:hypothetical protein N6G95_09615 [Pediococcus inopinatus]|uniref:hypothetical protein n=1 Tax=Pediococcus inopinatus TaxID=114090 RepID=UPI002B25AA8C|nr:hypothetical protein [Pediococcus inopinatus]WPC19460.1 hypothetical protein N6G95_09615 [Pediococcus inopinatus]
MLLEIDTNKLAENIVDAMTANIDEGIKQRGDYKEVRKDLIVKIKAAYENQSKMLSEAVLELLPSFIAAAQKDKLAPVIESLNALKGLEK